mmetsp:Transcript_21742/g.49226  ORF Transcript_21742/g.49226 Transcript_21742/m.49226 type:complete len:204 (+) Transcript_21742:799-1410(+)
MTEVPQAQSLLLSSEYLSLHQKNHNLFVCLAHLQRENKGPAQGNKIHVEKLQLWRNKVEVDVLRNRPNLPVEHLCCPESFLQALQNPFPTLTRKFVHKTHHDCVEHRSVEKPVKNDLVQDEQLPFDSNFVAIEELEPSMSHGSAQESSEENKRKKLAIDETFLFPLHHHDCLGPTIACCHQYSCCETLCSERMRFVCIDILLP